MYTVAKTAQYKVCLTYAGYRRSIKQKGSRFDQIGGEKMYSFPRTLCVAALATTATEYLVNSHSEELIRVANQLHEMNTSEDNSLPMLISAGIHVMTQLSQYPVCFASIPLISIGATYFITSVQHLVRGKKKLRQEKRTAEEMRESKEDEHWRLWWEAFVRENFSAEEQEEMLKGKRKGKTGARRAARREGTAARAGGATWTRSECSALMVLGLGPEKDWSIGEIRKAFQTKVKQVHPDRRPAAERKQAEKEVRDVLNAYKLLSESF